MQCTILDIILTMSVLLSEDKIRLTSKERGWLWLSGIQYDLTIASSVPRYVEWGVCGESWLAIKTHRPSSQGWAAGHPVSCSHVMYECL